MNPTTIRSPTLLAYMNSLRDTKIQYALYTTDHRFEHLLRPRVQGVFKLDSSSSTTTYVVPGHNTNDIQVYKESDLRQLVGASGTRREPLDPAAENPVAWDAQIVLDDSVDLATYKEVVLGRQLIFETHYRKDATVLFQIFVNEWCGWDTMSDVYAWDMILHFQVSDADSPLLHDFDAFQTYPCINNVTSCSKFLDLDTQHIVFNFMGMACSAWPPSPTIIESPSHYTCTFENFNDTDLISTVREKLIRPVCEAHRHIEVVQLIFDEHNEIGSACANPCIILIFEWENLYRRKMFFVDPWVFAKPQNDSLYHVIVRDMCKALQSALHLVGS